MKYLVIVGLLSFIFSCKSSIPKDILSPKKMQAVLWDVLQADEMAQYYSTTDSSFNGLEKHADYYYRIFAIHKISKQDFKRSISFYQNHPALLKPILDSLQHSSQRLHVDSVNRKPYKPPVSYTIKRNLRLPDRPT